MKARVGVVMVLGAGIAGMPSLCYGSIRKSNRFMASFSMTPSLTIRSVLKSLNVPVDCAQSVFSPL